MNATLFHTKSLHFSCQLKSVVGVHSTDMAIVAYSWLKLGVLQLHFTSLIGLLSILMQYIIN